MKPRNAPTFSVVVCTYDRNAWLPGLFEALAAQRLDGQRFEVIVVDNASPDPATRELEAAAREHPHLALRGVLEPRPGLAHARNRGVGAARGRWVAFTDDECRPPPNWLQSRAEAIATATSEPAGIAGPTHPEFIEPPPAWFEAAWLAIDAGDPARRVTHAWRELTISGSNLVLRRDVIEAAGGFETSAGKTGMTRGALGLGDETRLLARILERPELGPFLWDPSAPIRDLVFPDQITTASRARRAFVNAQLVEELAEREVARDRAARSLTGPARSQLGATLYRALVELGEVVAGSPARRHQSACKLAERCGRQLHRLRIRPTLRHRQARPARSR